MVLFCFYNVFPLLSFVIVLLPFIYDVDQASIINEIVEDEIEVEDDYYGEYYGF